jgi:hypothetical protein
MRPATRLESAFLYAFAGNAAVCIARGAAWLAGLDANHAVPWQGLCYAAAAAGLAIGWSKAGRRAR